MRHLPLPLICALAFASCAKKPGWAAASASAVGGDATVAGAPAPVGRFAGPPTLDGRLDDAAWAGATALGPFVDPGEGAADRSDLAGSFAKIGWDDQALYLGFVVPEGAPIAPFDRLQLDPHLWERSSAVEVMLQPGDPGDNRDYYELQFGTEGAVFDTHWDDYNFPITGSGADRVFGHQDWSSQATRAAVVEKGFYAVELALPWRAFAAGRTPIPPRAGDVWRLNLYAFRDGQRVANAWSPIKRQGNFHRSARFGRIVFR